MQHHRVSFYVLGLVTLMVGGSLLIPLFVSIGFKGDDTFAIGISALITLACGAALSLTTYKKDLAEEIHHRQAFVIAGFSWILMGLFGALPFIFYNVFGPISLDAITSSLFESVSGFTTTGATVITNVEALPHGILFWRSFTQWFGGLGIVVLSLAILPFLGVSGMQLYRAETSLITSEKLRPRIVDVAKLLWRVYLLLTVAEIILLSVGGMPLFDAICTALTTISSGGYSIKNAGIIAYESRFIEWVLIGFMFLAGVNFSLQYLAIAGKPNKLFKNGEFRFYVFVVLLSSSITIHFGQNRPG